MGIYLFILLAKKLLLSIEKLTPSFLIVMPKQFMGKSFSSFSGDNILGEFIKLSRFGEINDQFRVNRLAFTNV